MIQISNLLSMIPEMPAKTAGMALVDGGFAGLLAGELEGDAAVTGKTLPVQLPAGGKSLPLAASIDLSGELPAAAPVEALVPATPEDVAAKAPAAAPIVIPSIRLAAVTMTDPEPMLADEPELKAETPRSETHPLVAAKAIAVDLKARVRADRPETIEVADKPADPEAVDVAEAGVETEAEVDADVPTLRLAIVAEIPVETPAVLLGATDPAAFGQVEPMAANEPAPEEQLAADNRADVPRPEVKRADARMPDGPQSGLVDRTVAFKTETRQGTEKDPSGQGDRARGQRGNPELRFELSRASGEARIERAVATPSLQANQIRMPLAAASQIVLPEQAIVGQVADVAAAPTVTNMASNSFASEQGLRPHEFTSLVDRLVEARETARGASADVAVMHAEFGEVSLRFRQDASGLSVSMSNSDPEFARAVSAAAQADGAQMGDNGGQGGRRDDPAQNGGTFTRSNAGGDWGQSSADAGMNGGGRQHMQDGAQGEQMAAQPRTAEGEERSGRDGIYA